MAPFVQVLQKWKPFEFQKLDVALILDECGFAEEEVVVDDTFEDNDENDPDYVSDHSTRIINGWNAKPRPWMVLIRSVK